ncbi:MAG: DNA polymerase I [Candidatus Sungbacteria bacterium]|nr:DNA polymerase I [Candidatus Sungbacteria bacterium]
MAKQFKIKKTKKKLVLIDANAIIHRAFHALPPLTSPLGEPTNAVYGFTTILLRILREERPDYVVAAFDTPKPTFRHEAYKEYKATRVKAPDELYAQIPRVKEVLAAFGVSVFENEGFEADDVIGTAVERTQKKHPEVEIIIVTGDMDTLQLVGPKTKVWTMRKGVSDTVLYDEKAVRSRFGIGPKFLPDYKGLRGDPSDNIPGVKGIGEKTASDLLAPYETLEKLYQALESGKLVAREAVKEKLVQGKKDAFFSRELATIKKDAPVDFGLEKISRVAERRDDAVEKLFRDLGFFSLVKRLKEVAAAPVSKKNEVPAGNQGALFSSMGFPGVSAFRRALQKKVSSAAISFAEKESKIVMMLPNGKIFSFSWRDFSDETLKEFFESDTRKYVFGAKPVYKVLLPEGIQGRELFDFVLAAHLLDPGKSEYSFEGLAGAELGSVPPSGDVSATLQTLLKLGPKVEVRLKEEGLWDVFEAIEIPLAPILAEMEMRGIRFRIEPLKGLGMKVGKELKSLTGAVYKEAGVEFNLSSPQQVSEVLFEKMGITTKGIRKTGGGKISTKFSELSKLVGRHPIVEKIIRHRELSKLKTTYIDPLPEFVGKDGRLHTTFNQTRTETGRLASENPNLQNIPVKTEFGREIRKAFTAESGWTLVSFDYSQIELRIAADLANDRKMIEAFENGFDIHSLTAAEVNNVPLEKVTPELRRKAKALNFGVLYGMGARGFAEAAGITVEEAETFIAEYFNDFRGIAEFIEDTREFAREHGFVKTAFGRKRTLPGIVSPHPMIRSEAERMAVNTPIQGTAADVVKKAMIKVHGLIRERFLGKASMLLQIHDELLCELKEDSADEVLLEIKSAMEGVWRGRVRLGVDVKKGKNWGELS